MDIKQVSEAIKNISESYIEGDCVVVVAIKSGKAHIINVERLVEQPPQK